MNPVYRFTIDKKIYVFGMTGEPKTKEQLQELLNLLKSIKLEDGSEYSTDMITDIQVHNKYCPVGFIFLRWGQMAKNY